MLEDPLTGKNFRVEIDGLTLEGFMEVVLPTVSVETIEYREGSNVSASRKIAGLHKCSDVTFKRGVTNSNELFKWWYETAKGTPLRRTVAVVLQDGARNDVKRWVLTNVWPNRYHVEPLVAERDCILVEIIDCAVESFEIVA